MTGRSRRQFVQSGLALAAFGLLCGCGIVPPPAQRATKVARIGGLALSLRVPDPRLEAFMEGMRDLGYVDGQHYTLERRDARGSPERLPALATELVGLKVDVILTEGGASTQAARGATGEVPIVMGSVGDPVRQGLVASLARPGGNVTGLSLIAPGLAAKRLELLREAIPGVARVAVVWNPANPTSSGALGETQAAAESLGLQVQPLTASNPQEIDDAVGAGVAEGAGALITLADAWLYNQRAWVVEAAARSRLPGLFPEREFSEAGGLMAYGPNVPANFRRAATYVDKILKGAKPADLPVEQPTTFDLVVNLKTARVLGLTIPPSVLAQATEVIQ